eukprot:722281-Pelagomonas_calceolata.AAC.1
MGVGGTCYTEHTLNQLKRLGLDHQRAIKFARKLHAHSVQQNGHVVFVSYGCQQARKKERLCLPSPAANKLVTTRRAIENKDTSRSQLRGGGNSRPFRANAPPFPELMHFLLQLSCPYRQ